MSVFYSCSKTFSFAKIQTQKIECLWLLILIFFFSKRNSSVSNS